MHFECEHNESESNNLVGTNCSHTNKCEYECQMS